jgi:hypothetical protein
MGRRGGIRLMQEAIMAGRMVRGGRLALGIAGLGLVACASMKPQQVRTEAVREVALPPGGPTFEAPPQPGIEGRDTQGSMRRVRVAAQGFEVQVLAPTDADVTRRGDVARIEAGGHFALEIRRGGLGVDARKRAVEQTDGPRLQSFLVDTGEALLYETRATPQGLGGGFHVYAQRPVAGGLFTCKSADDLAFTREEAEAMLAACRSMTVLESL